MQARPVLLTGPGISAEVDTQVPVFTDECIVVGSGHAGSCAALSAVEHGCRPDRVLIIEKAPEEWVGGNGYAFVSLFRTFTSFRLYTTQVLHRRSTPNGTLGPRRPAPNCHCQRLPRTPPENSHRSLHPRRLPLRHPAHVIQSFLPSSHRHRR